MKSAIVAEDVVEYRIESRVQLSEHVFQMEVSAPMIARARHPGQFVIVGMDADGGERIPLTIGAGCKGTIRLIFQRWARPRPDGRPQGGDSLGMSPVGESHHIEKFGTVVRRRGIKYAAVSIAEGLSRPATGSSAFSAPVSALLILEDDFHAISDG
jgi:hypothetical protein